MYCEHCGAKSDGTSKFCTNCGKPLVSEKKQKAPPNANAVKRSPKQIAKYAGGVVIVGLIIWGSISSSKNDTAVQTSNAALNTITSSDTDSADQQGIQQLKDAYSNATDDATKLTILKNLAIVYEADNDNDDALTTYQKALQYASSGTSDYYLISSDIAQLQNDPNTAQTDLLQANNLNPNNYQILTDMGLFYLDLDNTWTTYDDIAKGLQDLKQAHDLEQNDISSENLAIAYNLNNDYDQSIALLLPLDLTAHPSASLYLGLDYYGKNDDKDATFYFQKAVDAGVQVPQDVTNYLNNQ
jgi:tetratricopeptide (TPR) repeat protein